jgi:competence protein ComEC
MAAKILRILAHLTIWVQKFPMERKLEPIVTRFRAYQLGCAGSSFSYFADNHFTLIEARLNDTNKRSVFGEMARCEIETIDCLHITSWDADHCSAAELPQLLLAFRPTRIECPGYEPLSDNGKTCRKILHGYEEAVRGSNRTVDLKYITPEFIHTLKPSNELAFRDVIYNPRWIDRNCCNNNSIVKLFRRGSFNMLSLGDVECCNISARLRSDKFLTREVDVLVLAHHGAANGFTNKPFVTRVKPQLAICTSNYDNQYDHPCQEIRDLLHEQRIKLMTTKTGDIIVESIGDHTGWFRATNLCAGSTEISSQHEYKSKKATLLSFNADTIRQLYAPRPAYRLL